jgi:hypothetical protein
MDQQHKYLFDLDASAEFGSIEEARDKLTALAEFARTELGLHIHGGSCAIAREREPVEFWRLGSDEPFTNMTATEGTKHNERFARSMAVST